MQKKKSRSRIPNILAVFIRGGVISTTKMKDARCAFQSNSTRRAAVPNSIVKLRKIISDRIFNRVILIGDSECEQADRNWLEHADVLRRCDMKTGDIRFYARKSSVPRSPQPNDRSDIEHELRKIGVSHCVTGDTVMLDQVPTIRHVYTFSDALPFKKHDAGQMFYNIHGGWSELYKLLLDTTS